MRGEVVQINTRIKGRPGMRKRLMLAAEHDYLLYENKGMSKPTVYRWMKFLIFRRLEEITNGIK